MNHSNSTYSSTGIQQMLINNEQTVDFADMNENKTLYANPYMVLNDREYTKHYYTEGQRIASKIGGGLAPSIVHYNQQITPITEDTYAVLSDRLLKRCQLSDDCVGFNGEYSIYPQTIKCIKNLADLDDEEKDRYFYHSDHIGSSSFITDRNGYASQHLQYLPFGELFVEQRSTANYYTPYKFSGKEKDEETSYSYFGARYYMSDVSVWLSVDPMAEKYPNMSPYMYCAGNPVIVIDPDGRSLIITGSNAKEAFSRLQCRSSLKLEMHAGGKVSVVSAPWIIWRRSDRKLYRLIKNSSITVHLLATNTNMTSAGIESRFGGAYMGNTVKKDASGKVISVDAYQEINETLLGEIEKQVRSKGELIEHEIIEAYIGGLIAKETGISSPNSTDKVKSTFDIAHKKANKYAYGDIKEIEIPGKKFEVNPDSDMRPYVPFVITDCTRKEYRFNVTE